MRRLSRHSQVRAQSTGLFCRATERGDERRRHERPGPHTAHNKSSRAGLATNQGRIQAFVQEIPLRRGEVGAWRRLQEVDAGNCGQRLIINVMLDFLCMQKRVCTNPYIKIIIINLQLIIIIKKNYIL